MTTKTTPRKKRNRAAKGQADAAEMGRRAATEPHTLGITDPSTGETVPMTASVNGQPVDLNAPPEELAKGPLGEVLKNAVTVAHDSPEALAEWDAETAPG